MNLRHMISQRYYKIKNITKREGYSSAFLQASGFLAVSRGMTPDNDSYRV